MRKRTKRPGEYSILVTNVRTGSQVWVELDLEELRSKVQEGLRKAGLYYPPHELN